MSGECRHSMLIVTFGGMDSKHIWYAPTFGCILMYDCASCRMQHAGHPASSLVLPDDAFLGASSFPLTAICFR